MRALCWNGVNDLRVETVPDPKIINPHDAILRVTMSTTCGSDLHFIDGYLPTMREGDVIGHEFMGEVVEIGPEVKKVKKGERVVVPSFIVCGQCWYCQHDLFSLCDNTNPKAELQEPLFGYPASMAILMPSAGTLERMRSTCGFHSQIMIASKFRRSCQTSRRYSYPMRRLPAIWVPIFATFSRGISWPCGVVAE